jgi:Tfp pilus assembly protein PilF
MAAAVGAQGEAMSRSNVLSAVLAFALGATTVLVAKTKIVFDPKAYYEGHDAKAASAALLAEAEKLAGDDTWQRIGIGRVAMLSGDKAKGESMFKSVLDNPKVDKNDFYRMATSYAVAKEWDKAKPLFEKAIALDLSDDSGIMKAACWFNVNGDRKRAEELFGIALGKNPDHTWHYILSAGSYVGVEPF